MSANPVTPPAASRPELTPKPIDELAAEQGVRPLDRFEDLFGAGRDLWTDDEFEAFLEQLRATRREEG
jgi:hypothetical protein